MSEFAIGFGILLFSVMVFRVPFKASGFVGVILFGVACWGIGRVVLLMLGGSK